MYSPAAPREPVLIVDTVVACGRSSESGLAEGRPGACVGTCVCVSKSRGDRRLSVCTGS